MAGCEWHPYQPTTVTWRQRRVSHGDGEVGRERREKDVQPSWMGQFNTIVSGPMLQLLFSSGVGKLSLKSLLCIFYLDVFKALQTQLVKN